LSFPVISKSGTKTGTKKPHNDKKYPTVPYKGWQVGVLETGSICGKKRLGNECSRRLFYRARAFLRALALTEKKLLIE